jgi:hypothetical protein
MQRTASCLCGQLTLRCSEEPIRVAACHCLSCQKADGSTYNVAAFFRLEDIEIIGVDIAYSRSSDSGYEVSLRFCPTCGSTVWYQSARKPEWIAVPVGGFGDPSFPPPAHQVYEEYRHPWVAAPPDPTLNGWKWPG